MVCRFSLYCQIKGKIIAKSKEIPTIENTNTGGSQGIFPPFPTINNNADTTSPAMKQVPDFLKNDVENIIISY